MGEGPRGQRVSIGQVISIPEGVGTVKLIKQELAYGIPGAELSATIYVDMADGTEIALNRYRFKEIEILQPIYDPNNRLIGYRRMGGNTLIPVPPKSIDRDIQEVAQDISDLSSDLGRS